MSAMSAAPSDAASRIAAVMFLDVVGYSALMAKDESGALGVVIDARGRPLQLPSDAVRRRELFKKWLWTLGG